MADKKTISSRIAHLLESLVQELDQEEIRRDVEALRRSKPDATREELAKSLMNKASLRTAATGAAAGAAGGAIALLAMAPDIFNLVREQSRLVLAIAFLHGQEPGLEERFREVLAVLAVSTGASTARQGARYLLKRGLQESVAEKIMRKIAGRFMVNRAPRLIPIIGGVIGGAINVVAIRAVHRAAMDYYGSLERKPED